jgi:hypothetical protein
MHEFRSGFDDDSHGILRSANARSVPAVARSRIIRLNENRPALHSRMRSLREPVSLIILGDVATTAL